MNRLLLVGAPRSGTTWIARVLSHAERTVYLGEPDNHFRFPFAFRAKRRLGKGQYPQLVVGDQAGDYERLWEAALAPAVEPGLGARSRRALARRLLARAPAEELSYALAGRPPSLRLQAIESLATPERPQGHGESLIVKSVYAQRSLEWLASRFPSTVVVVVREPLAVVSSWHQLGWLAERGDALETLDASAVSAGASDQLALPPFDIGRSAVGRAAWFVGLLMRSLLDAAGRHEEWHLVSHERLCERPRDGFRELCARIGFRWSEDVSDALEATNRPGAGYETMRVASELRDVWRSRLTTEEIDEASAVLSGFGLDASVGEAERR